MHTESFGRLFDHIFNDIDGKYHHDSTGCFSFPNCLKHIVKPSSVADELAGDLFN